MNKLKAIRHGEIMLVPVSKIPKGKTTKHTSYIVGHSETGHHHVLEGEFDVIEASNMDGEIFFSLLKPAKLVHKKATDKHRDLVIDKGFYQRFHDTEYDPFGKIIREVKD